MSKKSIEEIYKKKNPIEHIRDLPDTYIGSVEKSDTFCWINNNEKIINKNIQYIAGLYKIFDEVLVNAIDQATRCMIDENCNDKVTQIKVNIDSEMNTISIFNNGEGIPVVIHNEHNIYIPEMIFGNLLTSANYNKKEKKITGGKNGYGAKLTNIFSTEFIVETLDKVSKKKYKQVFTNNMSEKTKPIITKSSGKPFTRITFKPDLKIFNIKKWTPDLIALLEKRVFDCAACTDKSISVYLNDRKINCKSLDKYASFFDEYVSETVYEYINDRWEIVVGINNDESFKQVSFVNGIQTSNGGKHVDNAANIIARKLQSYVSSKGYKRKKNVKVKQAHLKQNMFIFLRSVIENPSFDSQIKEFLTTSPSKFGSKFEISDKFIEKLAKTSLIERALKLGIHQDSLNLKKVSTKKKSTIRGIPKLDDANKAGTKEAMKCTLILTEGDSAKALAISGLSVIGRDYFGVYPLRGKVINVRKMTIKKIVSNAEISSLMKILGLSVGMLRNKEKTEKIKILQEKLRYGKILIFTDQDVDGSHIKGLVMNLFHTLWPECLELENFIISLATPIVKVFKGKKVKQFFTLTEYENWIKKNSETGWKTKYYKGLGTSSSKEAKEYFTDFDNKKINYQYNEELCNNSIELAFKKENADLRKDWLKAYNRENIIEQTEKNVSFNDFINKDLIHFSNYDNERSLANMVDGLKPSLRKVLYSVLKRNLKSEIKVSQLAGYVSENSNYHHGEASLYECITGMAQNFVGSNNIELLKPIGQFGTRLVGGKDAGAPRYIHTMLAELTTKIFNPHDNDILEYNYDDGQKIEPMYYVPIIPMILINGSEGIGTGFSNKVPCYNPLDIISNLKRLMKKKKYKQMKPWYRGFTGEIKVRTMNDYGDEVFQSQGIWEKINDSTIEINELPIGTWTDNYKEFLEKLLYDNSADEKTKKKQCLVNYSSFYTESEVKFRLKFRKDVLADILEYGNIETKLKLIDTRNTNTSNINLYNSKCVLTKYDSIETILKEFYLVRLAFYIKRKEYLLKKYKHEFNIYHFKMKFIKGFISKTIKIINEDDEKIESQLIAMNFPKFSKNIKDFKNLDTSNLSYDYLLNMSIRSLTKKKMDELQILCDSKKNEIETLESKTECDLWNEDLNEFLVAYKKFIKRK